MKFADILGDIQTGDVFLFRGRNWYSWIIRQRTQSVYSHAGIAYRLKINGHTRLCIFEAVTGQGVRLYPMDQYLAECQRQKCTVDWYALDDPTATVNREKIADFCFVQWSSRYVSLWQLSWSFGWIGRAVRWLLGRPAVLDKDRYFCSELVAAAFAAGGYQHDEGTEPATTDPGAIARYTCLQRKGLLSP